MGLLARDDGVRNPISGDICQHETLGNVCSGVVDATGKRPTAKVGDHVESQIALLREDNVWAAIRVDVTYRDDDRILGRRQGVAIGQIPRGVAEEDADRPPDSAGDRHIRVAVAIEVANSNTPRLKRGLVSDRCRVPRGSG